MKNKLNILFKTEKPIIGMLHLGYLLGQKKFKSLDNLIKSAKNDLLALQKNGIDGILIENWKEDSNSEFITPEALVCMNTVINELTKIIKVPFGINVLNNDYKAAFSIAKLTHASFVQLDIFVDNVKSDFSYCPQAITSPFKIYPHPKEILSYSKKIGASQIPLFVFIQPKHYILLEKNKPIEKSAKQAIKSGASALIITKKTGVAPLLETIKKVKKISGNIPIGIGSGLTSKNIKEFLPYIDFAIVGSSLKKGGITDNHVDSGRVKNMMKTVKKTF